MRLTDIRDYWLLNRVLSKEKDPVKNTRKQICERDTENVEHCGRTAGESHLNTVKLEERNLFAENIDFMTANIFKIIERGNFW